MCNFHCSLRCSWWYFCKFTFIFLWKLFIVVKIWYIFWYHSVETPYFQVRKYICTIKIRYWFRGNRLRVEIYVILVIVTGVFGWTDWSNEMSFEQTRQVNCQNWHQNHRDSMISEQNCPNLFNYGDFGVLRLSSTNSFQWHEFGPSKPIFPVWV